MKRIIMAIAATVVLASSVLAQDYILKKHNIGSNFGIIDIRETEPELIVGALGGQTIASEAFAYGSQGGSVTHGFWAPFYGWTSSVEDNEPFESKNPLKVNNYPNPFKDQTTVSFELEEASYVSLRVYDLNGILVARLIGDEVLSAGEYKEDWNGKDLKQNDLASGSYLYELNVRPRNGGRTISVRNIMVMNK